MEDSRSSCVTGRQPLLMQCLMYLPLQKLRGSTLTRFRHQGTSLRRPRYGKVKVQSTYNS